MHNETMPEGNGPALPDNPRTAPGDVGYYGACGAEWLGADGQRYRTNTFGKGMYTLNGARPVPGMAAFRLGDRAARWAEEINEALNARDEHAAVSAQIAASPYTRVYSRATQPDGRVWFYGECPQLPGCLVYSEDEREIVGLLSEAIRVMSSAVPTTEAAEAPDHD